MLEKTFEAERELHQTLGNLSMQLACIIFIYLLIDHTSFHSIYLFKLSTYPYLFIFLANSIKLSLTPGEACHHPLPGKSFMHSYCYIQVYMNTYT